LKFYKTAIILVKGRYVTVKMCVKTYRDKKKTLKEAKFE